MYKGKYENHFLNIQASDDVIAEFARFTVEALQAPGIHALLAELLPTMQATTKAFGKGLSGRTATKGQSQTGTRTEEEAAQDFTALVQATDAKLLAPRFFDHPTEKATFYPDKLSGLTQAPKNKRLTRYTAYTETLEQHDDAAIRAAGAQARALLQAYTKAAQTKSKATKTLQDTTVDLDPQFVALAEALWQVHCTALYVHRAQPKQARTYFAYDKLPSRSRGAKKKPAGDQ